MLLDRNEKRLMEQYGQRHRLVITEIGREVRLPKTFLYSIYYDLHILSIWYKVETVGYHLTLKK